MIKCCFSWSLYWWFLKITVCLLQSGIPGNLHAFCPLPSLWLIVVLFLFWASFAPAVFNDRKRPRALLSSLIDDGGVSAHPSTDIVAVPLSFRISRLCMSLSSPSSPPSFVDCCVMFVLAPNKILLCWCYCQSSGSRCKVSGGVIHPSPPALLSPVAVITLALIVC